MDKARVFRRLADLRRRLTALAAAGATLWTLWTTAGSQTLAAAVRSAGAALPVELLRWELGDLWGGLSVPALLAIGESPLLLSAREEVAALWSREEEAPGPEPEAPPAPVRPVEETPLAAEPGPVDNGVPARTLIPTDPSGYTVAGKVYIRNSTGEGLSLRELTAPLSPLAEQDGPRILILHTHGSEAYTPPEGTEVVYTGEYRTTDSAFTVVQVGDEMARTFAEAGISVIHDRTMHDYPAYSGAYDRSLAAAEAYLAEYPSITYILDVHRDAVQDQEGNQYKVVSATDEGTAAQLTLVVGSDGSGAEHPHWRENLHLAAVVQQDILEQYPTLMRPLLLRSSRYNQHLLPGALLLEVGAAGNSPEEAALAGRLFARSMAETLLAAKENGER